MAHIAKNWIGTSYLDSFSPPQDACIYYVYQREKCPTTGRLHWQFFLQLKKKIRLSGLKKLIGECHAEVARSPKESRDYCMKDQTSVSAPIEYGIFYAPECIIMQVKKRSICQILEDQPSLWRSVRALQSAQDLFLGRRQSAPSVVLLSGPPAKGKTTIAKLISDFVGEQDSYWKGPTKWWDQYRQEKLVLWDEFRGQESLTLGEALMIFGSAPHMVERKGSCVHLNSGFILLTSNILLEQMYPSNQSHFSWLALKRRIKEHIIY